MCDIIKDNFDKDNSNSLCSSGNIFDKIYSEFTKNPNQLIGNLTSNLNQIIENDIATDIKFICDICEMKPIKDERYECTTCNIPYNLCGNCYEFKDDLHFTGHIFKCHIKSNA